MILRIATLFCFTIVCSAAQATTYANVTLDSVVERSSMVAHITVVSAEMLEIKDVGGKASSVPNCGFNVKARVETLYKGKKGKYIEFSTNKHVVVGDAYLGFMVPVDNASWFQNSWYRNFGKHELKSNEAACLKKLKYLKSESFPQRLIPLDSDGMLHISMTICDSPRPSNTRITCQTAMNLSFVNTITSSLNFRASTNT